LGRELPKSIIVHTISETVVHGFQIAAIWIKHEGSIISSMVVRARPRRSVVYSAGCKGCTVECIHARSVDSSEGNVNVSADRRAFSKPKVRLPVASKANMVWNFVGPAVAHEASDPEWRQRLFVETD
jgi:hypothetical protein